MKKYGVFISYSHTDIEILDPIIYIVKALRKDLVFQDTKEIVPGKLWRPQVIKALSEARLIILFWCHHSAKSVEVQEEYETALEQNKEILPILLDSTVLDERLGAYQWIDFKHLKLHSNEIEIREYQINKQTEAPNYNTKYLGNDGRDEIVMPGRNYLPSKREKFSWILIFRPAVLLTILVAILFFILVYYFNITIGIIFLCFAGFGLVIHIVWTWYKQRREYEKIEDVYKRFNPKVEVEWGSEYSHENARVNSIIAAAIIEKLNQKIKL